MWTSRNPWQTTSAGTATLRCSALLLRSGASPGLRRQQQHAPKHHVLSPQNKNYSSSLSRTRRSLPLQHGAAAAEWNNKNGIFQEQKRFCSSSNNSNSGPRPSMSDIDAAFRTLGDGVPADYDQKTLRKVFFNQVKKHHPDRKGGSTEKMQKLNSAYRLIRGLSQSEKHAYRQRYKNNNKSKKKTTTSSGTGTGSGGSSNNANATRSPGGDSSSYSNPNDFRNYGNRQYKGESRDASGNTYKSYYSHGGSGAYEARKPINFHHLKEAALHFADFGSKVYNRYFHRQFAYWVNRFDQEMRGVHARGELHSFMLMFGIIFLTVFSAILLVSFAWVGIMGPARKAKSERHRQVTLDQRMESLAKIAEGGGSSAEANMELARLGANLNAKTLIEDYILEPLRGSASRIQERRMFLRGFELLCRNIVNDGLAPSSAGEPRSWWRKARWFGKTSENETRSSGHTSTPRPNPVMSTGGAGSSHSPSNEGALSTMVPVDISNLGLDEDAFQVTHATPLCAALLSQCPLPVLKTLVRHTQRLQEELDAAKGFTLLVGDNSDDDDDVALQRARGQAAVGNSNPKKGANVLDRLGAVQSRQGWEGGPLAYTALQLLVSTDPALRDFWRTWPEWAQAVNLLLESGADPNFSAVPSRRSIRQQQDKDNGGLEYSGEADDEEEDHNHRVSPLFTVPKNKPPKTHVHVVTGEVVLDTTEIETGDGSSNTSLSPTIVATSPFLLLISNPLATSSLVSQFIHHGADYKDKRLDHMVTVSNVVALARVQGWLWGS